MQATTREARSAFTMANRTRCLLDPQSYGRRLWTGCLSLRSSTVRPTVRGVGVRTSSARGFSNSSSRRVYHNVEGAPESPHQYKMKDPEPLNVERPPQNAITKENNRVFNHELLRRKINWKKLSLFFGGAVLMAAAAVPAYRNLPDSAKESGKAQWAYLKENVDPSYIPPQVYGLVIACLGGAMVWISHQHQWWKRNFLGHVNFSLNYMDNGVFKFRTICEIDVASLVCKNQAAVNVVLKAANATVPGRPFLEIPASENWFIMNNAINVISSQCTLGFFQASRGLPVHRAVYICGITCEKESEVWNRKMRVMIIERNFLESIPQMKRPPPENPQLSISTRWSTLREMSRIWLEQETLNDPLAMVEICLPLPHMPPPGSTASSSTTASPLAGSVVNLTQASTHL